MIKKTIGSVLLVLTLFLFVGCNGNPIFIIEEPTTEALTTEVQTTTETPTTVGPTTEVPTTVGPTTEVPTTIAPTTVAPTTEENLIVELFFSEYGEGSGYNKYIEIYNGTGQAIDLSPYSVQLYSNGSATVSQSLSLSGILDNNDVFVMAHVSASAEILAQADMTDSSVVNWNGNDAVSLSKNGIVIDVIGEIGVDSAFAQDVTLVRKDTVITPTTTWDINEWDSYPSDTFDYIGFHTDVQPDDSVLLQQDVDALPNHIDLIGNYDFGIGANGSTYNIQSVTGTAADYVNYDIGSNYIESTLTTNGEYTGEISVEVTFGELSTIKLISVTVKFTNLDTNTHPEYYSSLAEGISGETLLLALRSLLNDTYVGVTYGEARYMLDETDADPNNPDNVILVYTRSSVSGVWDSGATWNREHVWPQSLLGESADNNTVNSASDLHNLKPAKPSENSSRGNKYFDNVGSSSAYEPHDDVKGDVARILLYMMVMYPELSLVNTVPTTYEMALLDVLLSWHIQDPVDDFELNRNNVIYFYQGNRNPFIDNPEYVDLIWGDNTTN